MRSDRSCGASLRLGGCAAGPRVASRQNGGHDGRDQADYRRDTVSNPQVPAALPPAAMLMKLMAGKCITQALASAAKLGVADQLKGGARTAEAIAPAIG